MEIRVVDFELLTRHFDKYQKGVAEIDKEKAQILESIEPMRREMQNIIAASQGGIIVDNLTQEQRMEKFQRLQSQMVEIDKDAKYKLSKMGQKLKEEVYEDIEKIVSEYSIKNSIDAVISKIETVYAGEKFEITSQILEVFKEMNIFSEYVEKSEKKES
jgi:Skp family chaperone for outer membrane proteins